jgi:hypothetical protein
MYSVYAGSDLVGHTALENGDAPMGVAFGIFIPSDEYAHIREFCQRNHSDQSTLQLSVATEIGETIPAVGVSVLDYSAMVDEPEIQVNLIGVDAALYEALFPMHVRAYRQRFA